jgi:pimeloyl-ACP methyl ester carboxylesterase
MSGYPTAGSDVLGNAGAGQRLGEEVMRRRSRCITSVALAALVAAFGVAPSARAGRGRHRWHRASAIVELPISFNVQNLNRSRVPCLSDGRAHTIRGHLVAPRATLTSSAVPRAVTLYLHGTTVGEPTWRFTGVAGYDYAFEQAEAGHASVTIDQLGYGASDIPNGLQICTGSQADIAHQIVGKLRRGDYRVASGRPPTFQRVALAGHSFGGLISPIEAYSFNDIDALVIADSAIDQFGSFANTTEVFARPDGVLAVCLRLGDPKRPGATGGYAYTYTPDTPLLFSNADPAVVDAFAGLRERDPCGPWGSAQLTQLADRLYLSTITVPVLLVFGRQDAIFPPPEGEQQKALYTGSHDVTFTYIENAGHMVMLQRTAPAFRSTVSSWLQARGF